MLAWAKVRNSKCSSHVILGWIRVHFYLWTSGREANIRVAGHGLQWAFALGIIIIIIIIITIIIIIIIIIKLLW